MASILTIKQLRAFIISEERMGLENEKDKKLLRVGMEVVRPYKRKR